MKVLLVSDLAPYPILGGLALHAISLGNYFIKLGHQVDFLGNGRYGSKDKVQQMNFDGDLMLNGKMDKGNLGRRIEKYGGVYPYALHKQCAKRIADVINEQGLSYDVVHYHGHHPILSNYVHSRINFVQTHHDHGTICPKKVFMNSSGTICRSTNSSNCAECYSEKPNLVQRRISSMGSSAWRNEMNHAFSKHKHIFVSKRLLDIALSVLERDKIDGASVIHNFIECEKIRSIVAESNNEYNNARQSGKLKLLIAGSSEAFKGVRRFLAGFNNDNCHVDWELLVIGHGTDNENWQIRPSNLTVSFSGWLPYNETIKKMSEHDVYILTSISEESCSTSTLEALFLNKDVRALHLGGTPELLQYSEDPKQMKLYNTFEEMRMDLLNSDNVYSSSNAFNSRFKACIRDKAPDILKVYTL